MQYPHVALVRVLALGTSVTLLIQACGGGSDSNSVLTAPVPPVPGTLIVTLKTPNGTEGAARITISGPDSASAATALAGATLYTRGTLHETRIAIFGKLADGDIATIDVPDIHRATAFSASLGEVADTANALRADLTGYTVTLRAK